jgi:chromate reductase, NAD(P)H dehydrogenase (quinone)
MPSTVKILAFAGSLRKESFNKKLVKIACEGAKQAGAEVTYIDLKDYPLPIYDEDLEKTDGLPENAKKLKQMFLEHQALLLACPEYNSSITGVLKNVIDWVSRPQSGEKPLACFDGKVASLLAASPGAFGGLRGLVTVRSILGNIKVTVLPEQLAVATAHEAFDENGNLKDSKQKESAAAIGRSLAETTSKLAGLALPVGSRN